MANIFFDLDKTIIKKDSLVPFIIFYVSKRPLRIFYFLFILLCALLYKIKIIGNQKIKEIVSGIFKNESVSNMSELALMFVEKYIPSLYYQNAIEAIGNHKKKGDRIIMVTASYLFYAEHIAKKLGFDKCIASELWRHGHIYTGRLYGKNCHGIEKRHRLLSEGFRENEGAASFAYSDSHSDLPLFKFAAAKICVNPDDKLYKYAKAHFSEGYNIVRWK